MLSRTSVVKLFRDDHGASMLEAAVAMPVFLAVMLGTLDLGIFFTQWTMARKAVQLGAREAVIRNPIVRGNGLPDTTWNVTELGVTCSSATATTGYCPTFDVEYTSAAVYCHHVSANQVCTSGTYDKGASSGTTAQVTTDVNAIVAKMQGVFPGFSAANLSVRYTSNGIGFTGQPYAIGSTVTVSIRNMSYSLVALNGLASAAFGTTLQIRASSALPGEDLSS